MTPPKIFGLLGLSLRHSFSPVMHNAAFGALKIKAKYKIFEKKPEELRKFLNSLNKINVSGLNVTVPYKERVIPFLKYKSAATEAIGAVNTLLVDKDGTLKGHNTDYLGFSRHIYSELKLKPKKVAILGAGGAAKAVVFALAKKQAEQIRIFDIDKFKSLSLMKRFRSIFPECDIQAVGSLEELKIKEADLLINASPIGMHNTDPCVVNASMLHSGLFVYDLIYNPAETKLLRLAEENGCKFSNGLGMLLYQGVEAFNLWLKPKKAPVEVMRRALTEGLRKC